MSNIAYPKNLSAFLETTGTEAPPSETDAGKVTLGVNTYYFEILATDKALQQAIEILTDATIVATFTIEECVFPSTRQNQPGGAADVLTYEASSVANWVQMNVAAAGYAQGAGTGWTITVLSLVKAAGVGGAIINLNASGSLRRRIKAVVTTGGKVRVAAHGKD